MKLILQEYCAELLNTGPFKKDAKSATRDVYRDLAKHYGNDKGQFTLVQGQGLRRLRQYAATRAGSACTSC